MAKKYAPKKKLTGEAAWSKGKLPDIVKTKGDPALPKMHAHKDAPEVPLLGPPPGPDFIAYELPPDWGMIIEASPDPDDDSIAVQIVAPGDAVIEEDAGTFRRMDAAEFADEYEGTSGLASR